VYRVRYDHLNPAPEDPPSDIPRPDPVRKPVTTRERLLSRLRPFPGAWGAGPQAEPRGHLRVGRAVRRRVYEGGARSPRDAVVQGLRAEERTSDPPDPAGGDVLRPGVPDPSGRSLMPAPKNPNTVAATAAVRRRGDETAAARLRTHGWLVIPPEAAADLPAELTALCAS